MVELIRKEYNIIAKRRGIIGPQNMSTRVNTLSRWDSRREVKNNRRRFLKTKLEKVTKIQNISKKEINHVEKLQKRYIDELQGIARLKRTKNSDNF